MRVPTVGREVRVEPRSSWGTRFFYSFFAALLDLLEVGAAEVEVAEARRARLGAAEGSGSGQARILEEGWLWLVTIGTDDTSDADMRSPSIPVC